MPTSARRPRAEPTLARWIAQLAAFAVLWWIISEGEPGSWLFGIPAIALAAYLAADSGSASVLALHPLRLGWAGAAFVWESIRGGVDVARRVLGPKLAVAPDIVSYDWRLPEGGLRVVAMAMISLQPGTLVVGSDARTVWVHVLDRAIPLAAQLPRLEDRLARLAGRAPLPAAVDRQ